MYKNIREDNAMKRGLKALILIFITALFFTIGGLVISADGESTPVLYEMYDADGNMIKTGSTPREFCLDLRNNLDFVKVVLKNDIIVPMTYNQQGAGNAATSRVVVNEVPDVHREVSLDIAGHTLAFQGKIETPAVRAANNVTVNVYSSVPGGHFTCSDYRSSHKDYVGDELVGMVGENSVMNVGRYDDGNRVYPGSNLTCSAVMLCGLMSRDGSALNFDGATLVRISTVDHRAMFTVGSGTASLNIKNSAILGFGSILRLNGDTNNTTLENCIVSNYTSEDPKYCKVSSPTLVNTTEYPSKNYWYGELTLKNTSVNTSMDVPEESQDGAFKGNLSFEGDVFFIKDYVDGWIKDYIQGYEDRVVAKVSNRAFSRGFAKEGYSYTVYDPNVNSYVKVPITMIANPPAATYCQPEDAAECTFDNGITTESGFYYVGGEILTDLDIAEEDVQGVYHYEWCYTEKNGKRYYTPKLISEYEFYSSYSFNSTDGVTTNFYLSASLFENYLDYNYLAFNGKIANKSNFKRDTIGGKAFYKIEIEGIHNVTAFLPGKSGDATFALSVKISFRDYLEKLLESNLSDDTLSFIYDLAVYAINSYGADEGYTDDINYLAKLIEGKKVTAGDNALFKDINITETDSSYFTENFGKIHVSDMGQLSFEIPNGFTGKLAVSIENYEKVYEISSGKWEGYEDIILNLPTDLILKVICLKVYDSDGNLLCKEGDTVSGTFSISEWLGSIEDNDALVLKSGIAIRCGITRRNADDPE
jgi:hypothetical protein